MRRTRILNSEFDELTLEQTVGQVVSAVGDGTRGWLCTVNVAILMMMRSDPKLQNFVEKASWIIADGQPLVWVAPLFGGHLPERVTGIDLLVALFEVAEQENLRFYFLGAKYPVIKQAADELVRRYPRAEVCGVADGYFESREARDRADDIRNSGANVLFVGMGVPRQERFIEEQWDHLGVNVAIGVGGSFEVLAGVRKRAPKFYQRVGMEWLFRLMQEPRRMAKRYLVTNTQFVLLVARESVIRVFSGRRKQQS